MPCSDDAHKLTERWTLMAWIYGAVICCGLQGVLFAGRGLRDAVDRWRRCDRSRAGIAMDTASSPDPKTERAMRAIMEIRRREG